MLQRRAPRDTVRNRRLSLPLLHPLVAATVVHPPPCKPPLLCPLQVTSTKLCPTARIWPVDTRAWIVVMVIPRGRMALATWHLGCVLVFLFSDIRSSRGGYDLVWH